MFRTQLFHRVRTLFAGLSLVLIALSMVVGPAPVIRAQQPTGAESTKASSDGDRPQPVTDAERAKMDSGKEAVAAYITAAKLPVKEGSEDYLALLQGILNDQHPEVLKGKAGDAVTFYSIRMLKLEADTITKDVDMTKPDPQPQPNLWVGYDRWAARNYTYQWTSWNGGRVRNPAYKDFGSSDCTNLMSQALRAGGITMAGSGPGGNENNATEWYMYKMGTSWGWSNSWSVVSNFRYYMRDKKGAYVEAYSANTEAMSLLISRALEGDVIQFDVRDCDACAWVPTHAVMVSTKQNKGGYYANDITYNDHSGGSNYNDSRDASLRAKLTTWSSQGLTNRRRMVWIKMW